MDIILNPQKVSRRTAAFFTHGLGAETKNPQVSYKSQARTLLNEQISLLDEIKAFVETTFPGGLSADQLQFFREIPKTREYAKRTLEKASTADSADQWDPYWQDTVTGVTRAVDRARSMRDSIKATYAANSKSAALDYHLKIIAALDEIRPLLKKYATSLTDMQQKFAANFDSGYADELSLQKIAQDMPEISREWQKIVPGLKTAYEFLQKMLDELKALSPPDEVATETKSDNTVLYIGLAAAAAIAIILMRRR